MRQLTLNLTEKELNVLQNAVQYHIDFLDDTTTEPLYHRAEDGPISHEQMREIRNQVSENIDTLLAIHSLVNKINQQL